MLEFRVRTEEVWLYPGKIAENGDSAFEINAQLRKRCERNILKMPGQSFSAVRFSSRWRYMSREVVTGAGGGEP